MGIRLNIEILEKRVFRPGETFRGIVHVRLEKKCAIQGIQVILKGKARVRWTEEGSTEEDTHVYTAREDYFEYKFYVFGKATQTESLAAGHHCFPIDFKLPPSLPSSFVSAHGKVEYYAKALVPRVGKERTKVKVHFPLSGYLDLTCEKGASGQPIKICRKKRTSFFCFPTTGYPVGFVLTLPRTGFIPNEPLHFTVDIRTKGSDETIKSAIQLVQIIKYHGSGKTLETSQIITSLEQLHHVTAPAFNKHEDETEVWSDALALPQNLPPTRLCNCHLIHVQYKLKFILEINGLLTNACGDIPLVIGTIPFPPVKGNGKEEWSCVGEHVPSAPPMPPLYSQAIQQEP